MKETGETDGGLEAISVGIVGGEWRPEANNNLFAHVIYGIEKLLMAQEKASQFFFCILLGSTFQLSSWFFYFVGLYFLGQSNITIDIILLWVISGLGCIYIDGFGGCCYWLAVWIEMELLTGWGNEMSESGTVIEFASQCSVGIYPVVVVTKATTPRKRLLTLPTAGRTCKYSSRKYTPAIALIIITVNYIPCDKSDFYRQPVQLLDWQECKITS